ncbi:MAG: hypothetical protein ABR920_13600 [Terriglobales bacterium]
MARPALRVFQQLVSAGARTLTATYGGDSNFSASAGTAAQAVNAASTATTITAASPNPALIGQPVTVSFTVAAVAPGAGTPTGSVTVNVTDGSGVNCSAVLSGGSGSCALTPASTGANTPETM